MTVDEKFAITESLKIFKNLLKEADQIILCMEYGEKMVIRNSFNKKKRRKSCFLEIKEE
jgi:hypothetical protein